MSPGRLRELVFQKNAAFFQLGIFNHLRHGAQGVAPGIDFIGRGVVSVVREERGFELVGNLVLNAVADELLGAAGVEPHSASPTGFWPSGFLIFRIFFSAAADCFSGIFLFVQIHLF